MSTMKHNGAYQERPVYLHYWSIVLRQSLMEFKTLTVEKLVHVAY